MALLYTLKKLKEDAMQYELTTIKDIFDNVPASKIETCLKEMAAGMVQAKHMNEILKTTAEELTGHEIEKAIEWPEICTWIDDDKGEIHLTFSG